MDDQSQMNIIHNSDSQELLASPELRKLKQQFSKKAIARANLSASPNRTLKKLPLNNDSKLEIADDGEIVYEGEFNNLDSIFPADGVIRIKQAPPKIDGDSIEHINDML